MNKDQIHELLEKHSIKNEINSLLNILCEGRKAFTISTGFPSLDQILNGGIHSGQLITIGARPSIGKTGFAISLIRNMLERRKKILFFSLEMPSSEIIKRLVADISGVSSYDISQNNLCDDELAKVVSATEYLVDKSLFIVNIARISIETLLDITRVATIEKHLDCILIDYFSLIDGITSSSDKYESAVRQIQDLAKYLNVPIITMFQFPRDSNQGEPSLADVPCIMNSLVDNSDVVLFLHRYRSGEQCTKVGEDNVKSLQVAKVIIAKNMNGDIGHTFLGFNGATTLFKNIEII